MSEMLVDIMQISQPGELRCEQLQQMGEWVASGPKVVETEDVERFLGLEGENLSARQDTPEAVSTATLGSV